MPENSSTKSKTRYTEALGSVYDTMGWAYYQLARLQKSTSEKKSSLNKAIKNFETGIAHIKKSAGVQARSLPTVFSHIADALEMKGSVENNKKYKIEALKNYLEANKYGRFAEKSHVAQQIIELQEAGIKVPEE